MKIKNEFNIGINPDKFLGVIDIFLTEAERSGEAKFIPISLRLFKNINEDELEEIIRILEWKNLLVRKYEPLKTQKVFVSVPKISELQNYKFELEKPIFDEQKGILKFRGREVKFKRNSQQWKLIKLLYDEPNKIFDYKEISKAVDLIDNYDYKAWSEKTKAFAVYKKKINNLVNEIKTKLSFPKKDQSLLFCNNGYMMRR